MTKKKYFVFGDKINRQRHIRIEIYMIEILNEFKYLGFIFNKKRKFSSMYVVNQARKALFGLYSKIRNLDISIVCQLKLFDNLVVPILTNGCKISGFVDLSGIDKVQTDFLKRILKVKQSTRSVMLYGDLGCVPLSISIKKRVIGY